MKPNAGQFKKGEHWRPRQLFWDRDWLYNEYIAKQRSSSEIAVDFGVTAHAIVFWLNKLNIPTRSTREIRSIKHWGLSGEKNGMYGVTGEDNPHWKGGCTPDRQAFYCSEAWAKACLFVWQRDRATCQRCGDVPVKMHIHHIASFAVVDLRADPRNLILLCVDCHHFVHSRKNVNKEFIREEV
jgi:hypothetical protein